jgi:hypothetical protein
VQNCGNGEKTGGGIGEKTGECSGRIGDTLAHESQLWYDHLTVGQAAFHLILATHMESHGIERKTKMKSFNVMSICT